MTDKMTPAQRHYCMSRIHGKATKPELKVRQWLWQHGYRYRLNVKSVPGKPDIVMRRYRTAIFVNGCFWHGHDVHLSVESLELKVESQLEVESGELKVNNSKCCKIPQTNREFWVAKIRRNQERDIEEQKVLADMGWHCITVWECELKPKVREQTLKSLAFTLNKIWLDDHRKAAIPYPQLEEEDGMLKAAEE